MSEERPKVFISYSWSSQAHRDRIREYAERLIGDNVDVILDQWHLREGQDKNAFMEKMTTDPTVTHVLVFLDKQYATKANQRKAGVGTESQIISQEVYKKVDQEKFIPIACELDENEEAYSPTFFASRIWIDFSSPERRTKTGSGWCEYCTASRHMRSRHSEKRHRTSLIVNGDYLAQQLVSFRR